MFVIPAGLQRKLELEQQLGISLLRNLIVPRDLMIFKLFRFDNQSDQ